MDALVAAVADWAINSAANRRVPLSAFAAPTQQYALPNAIRSNHWSDRTRDRRSKKERGHEHAHVHDTQTQTQLPAIAGATSHRKSPPPLEQHPLVPNTPASFGRPLRNHAGCTVHPSGIPMLPQHLVGHVPLSPESVEQRRRGRSLHGAAKRTRTQKQRVEKTLETRRYQYEEDDEGTRDERALKLKRKLMRAERGRDDQAALSSWSGSNNNHGAGEVPTGHHMERSIDTQSKRHLGAIINQAMASFEDVRQSRQMMEQTSPSNERRGRRVGGNKQRKVRRRRRLPAMSAAGVARHGFSWIP